MNKFVVVCIFSFFLISCGGGSKSKSQPTPVSAIIQVQNDTAIAGDNIQLSASSSAGEGTLSYQWQLVAKPNGSQVSLSNTKSTDLEFAADVAGNYQISLTVTDNNGSSSAEQMISVAVNNPPVINTELSSNLESVVAGDTIRLDANQSTDPEQRALSYKWEFLSQPESSSLADSTDDYFDFAPVIRGGYEIQLSVSDGFNTTTQLFEYKAIQSRVVALFDADSSQSAVEQVETVFGEGSAELPQYHLDALLTEIETNNHLFVEHDPSFVLHTKEDGDRHKKLTFSHKDNLDTKTQTHKQRTEIRTFAASPETTTCSNGETMLANWNFKADNLNLSTAHTHIFQLRGEDEDDEPEFNHSLLTLTAKRTDGVEALRLVYSKQDNDTVLGEIPWEIANDRWLNVQLSFECKQAGSVKLKVINVVTDEVLLDIQPDNLDMWPSWKNLKEDFLHLKWGFYRPVLDNEGQWKNGLDSLEDKVRVSAIRIETH